MSNARTSGGFVVLLLTILCVLPSMGWATATTWPVDCSSQSIQTTLDGANSGDTVQVTGPCTETVDVKLNGVILIANTPGTVIQSQDQTLPVVTVNAQNVTINGFTMEGGTIGVQVSGLASANIVNNTIQNNSTAGIVVKDNSSAHIGFIHGNDTTALPNQIIGNPQGIIISGNSSAGIVGNTISSSGITTAAGNGIQVERVSQANIAGNIIDSFQNGISVSGNSGVNLADGTSSPFNALNGTDPTTKNTAAAVACSMGGYVSGYLGSLAGAKASSFDSTCIDALHSAPTSNLLIGVWNVVKVYGIVNDPPTQTTFNADGTGTSVTTQTQDPIKWTLTGTHLSITNLTKQDTVLGLLTWSDVNDITFGPFTPPDMKTTVTLKLQRQ